MPIIGIISNPYFDYDKSEVAQVSANVVNFVNSVGATPISILPTNVDEFHKSDKSNLKKPTIEELEKLKNVLRMCDGIIKPGSYFFFPYQEEIYKYSLRYNIPYLGICNGLQLMSRCIDKSKMERNNSDIYHTSTFHEVDIEKNSLLYKIIGKDKIVVRSFHNYHVPSTTHFLVNARSSDGYIEGMENTDSLFNLGVQWHPEANLHDEDSVKLFESFIDAAKVYVKKRLI